MSVSLTLYKEYRFDGGVPKQGKCLKHKTEQLLPLTYLSAEDRKIAHHLGNIQVQRTALILIEKRNPFSLCKDVL
jgi:hypothetical protein